MFSRAAKVLVVIADGSEEIEAVVAIDILRRADLNVCVASIEQTDSVKCSRDVMLKADKTLLEVHKEKFDAIVLPGGLGGCQQFSKCALLGSLLRSACEDGILVAAICAAPTVLADFGLFVGSSITSHPSLKAKLTSSYQYMDSDKVVIDKNLITSRGPGTSFDFALAIVAKLVSKDKAKSLRAPLCLE